MTEKLRYIEMDNGDRLYEHKDGKEYVMKDEIVKIAGSRTKGFTKKQLKEIFKKFNLDSDWNRLYYRISRYDIGLYFDSGKWHYDDAYFYKSYIGLIHKTDKDYFGMAIGGASEFVRSNRDLVREVFPLKDFI